MSLNEIFAFKELNITATTNNYFLDNICPESYCLSEAVALKLMTQFVQVIHFNPNIQSQFSILDNMNYAIISIEN